MSLPHFFYVQDLDTVVFEMIGMFFVWTALMLVLKGKARRIVSICAAVLSIVLILMMTVYKRSSADTARISLIPFISFFNALEEVEIYRSMLMNVCLFLPLGLCLPFALSYKTRHNLIYTALSTLILSVFVESMQYIFHMGLCETDDVIMNVLGALTGILSFVICKRIESFKAKHIHRHISR